MSKSSKNSRNVHELIPFRNLLKLVVGFAVAIQVIIIVVNHLTGFFELNSFTHFLFRLLRGSLLSIIATIAVVYPDLYIIRFLSSRMGWKKMVFGRVVIQFMLTVLIGAIAATGFTALGHFITPYRDGLLVTMGYNLMIFAVCNIILMIILEAWIFFIEGAKSRKRSNKLEGELTQLRFEMLKKQIDSHFLFNSLNVLSGLIEKDSGLAQDFIDEFSSLYRYVLDSIDKRVVTVRDEISFARSYLYLQQMRYGKGLTYSVDLPSELLDGYMPPLSLQIVLENACKHNSVSKKSPLKILISGNNSELVVKNNIQSKRSPTRGTKTGQSNLIKRYSLLSNSKPEFHVGTTQYTAKLPIIFEEES
jgi:hypothetical protein